MTFWKFFWDFVKDEVMDFVKEFHEHGNFEKSLNATFLVLVPKKGGAQDLKDFRLISLVGDGFYKWLVNRLKKVIGRVVSSTQSVFVGDKFRMQYFFLLRLLIPF